MPTVYRLETDLLRKSRPKFGSKRFMRLKDALHKAGITTVMVRCERCKKSLLNPQSILIHQGGFCQAQLNKKV